MSLHVRPANAQDDCRCTWRLSFVVDSVRATYAFSNSTAAQGPVEMPGQATRAEISGRTDARGGLASVGRCGWLLPSSCFSMIILGSSLDAGAFKAGQMEAPSYKVIAGSLTNAIQTCCESSYA